MMFKKLMSFWDSVELLSLNLEGLIVCLQWSPSPDSTPLHSTSLHFTVGQLVSVFSSIIHELYTAFFFLVPDLVMERFACILLVSLYWFYLTVQLLATWVLVWSCCGQWELSSAQGYEFKSHKFQRDAMRQTHETRNLRLALLMVDSGSAFGLCRFIND